MKKAIHDMMIPKNFLEQQLVKHVFYGQEALAAAFTVFLDHNISDNILSSIIFSSAPETFTPNTNCENYTKVRWKAHIARSFINNSDLPQEFYHLIIKNLKAPWASELYEILSTFEPEDIVSSNAIKVLSQAYHQNQQAFASVIPTVDFILNNVQSKELFKKMSFDTFAMKPFLTEQTVQSFDVSTLTNSNLPSFFNNFFLLKVPNVQQILQKLIFFSEPNIQHSELFEQGSHFQMSNTCIIKKRNLVDLILEKPLNMLNSGNFNSYFEQMKKFPDLIGPIFICFYDTYKNSEEYIEFMKHLTSYNSPCNIINRIVNDSIITNYVNENTGLEIVSSDFHYSSVSQLLFPRILHLDLSSLEDLSQRQYFCISDSERKSDFAFIFGYIALTNALNFITQKTPLYIGDLLVMIEDEEKRKSLVVDLFSLIFLRKDNKYICDVNMAEQILLCISGFLSDEGFMKSATGRFLFTKILGSETLESALVSTQEGVIKMLNMNEPDIALYMSANMPTLFNIVKCIVCEESTIYDKPDIYFVEKFFSRGIFGELNIDCVSCSEAKILYEQRKKQNHPLDLIRSEYIKECLDSFKYIGYLCMNYGGHFSDFMRYRYTYSRLMRRAKIQKKGRLRIPELVQIIVETSYLTEEESLRILLGEHSYETILAHENVYEVNSYLFELIRKKCEVCAYCLLINNPSAAKIEGNSPLKRLFLQKEPDPDFVALSDSDFISKFHTEKPLDFDEMNDLFFRRPELFTKEVENHFEEFTPFEISQFLPYSDKTSLFGLQKLGITSMNITNIFNFLLSITNHSLLQQFILDFKLEDEFCHFFSGYIPDHVFHIFKNSSQFLYRYLYSLPQTVVEIVEEEITKIQSKWSVDSNKNDIRQEDDKLSLYSWYLRERRKYGQQISSLKTLIIKSRDYSLIKSLSEEFFQTFDIDNSEDEYEVFLLLRELRILNDCKFDALLRFVSRFVCSRYDIVYKLSDHKKLIDICFKIDDLSTLDILCNAFSVSFTPYGEEFSVICAKLSLSLQSMGLLQCQSKSREFGEKIISTMMSKMRISIPSNIDCIETFKENISNSPIPHFEEFHPDIISISDVLLQLQIYDCACSFCVIHQQFDQAFDIFNIAEGDCDFFIDNIFTPALSTSFETWSCLWSTYNRRRILNDFEFERFVRKIESYHCFDILIDIYKSLNMSERLVTFLTISLRNSKSFNEEVKILNDLIKSVDVVIKTQTSLSEKKKYVLLKNRCENQKRIINICNQREISYSPSISIVTSSEDAMSTCCMLMRLCEVTIVLDISPDLASYFTFEDICSQVVSSFRKSSEGSVERWLKTLGKKCHGIEYELAIDIIISIIIDSQSHHDEESFKYLTQFIKENVFSEFCKCKSFCKIGNLDEALASAKLCPETSSKELYNEIKISSIKFGNSAVESKCNKILKTL
ncbi:hypothetical protein TVAG_159000 [Trichomonas vaginalis G3]|uniref:Uncharacterized protein n=1 Tax=Trichomonas vaginalis (strain ATCC PRA-98 / G3) TaxID=412133 RepID=A2E6S9_TRIV3|nr:hypothetical protein TVAGG3_0779170 [Trichomonas vaginalis G3]EAY11673.1 hypothetical protein TVAG_159000 [Trichomonas vaginalis G3]KAI5494922.1 hypothetical protein TVAGG3_0779170 [Trichomonas vaginalis G3]|eukprot:XP_001323896.1 hypothetical protein [Trichomonas vaginalis G3]